MDLEAASASNQFVAVLRIAMSQTEVHTLERVRQANSSNGSLSINAKVPHISEQETTVQRKPHPNNDDIELAELTRRSGSRDAVPATGGAQGSAHEVDVNSPEVKLTAWLQYSSLCFTCTTNLSSVLHQCLQWIHRWSTR